MKQFIRFKPPHFIINSSMFSADLSKFLQVQWHLEIYPYTKHIQQISNLLLCFSSIRKLFHASAAVKASSLFIVDTVGPSSDSRLLQMALETDAISQGSAPFGSNNWCSMCPLHACACGNVRIHACVCVCVSERQRQLSICLSEFNPSAAIKTTKNGSHWHGHVCLAVRSYKWHVYVCRIRLL